MTRSRIIGTNRNNNILNNSNILNRSIQSIRNQNTSQQNLLLKERLDESRLELLYIEKMTRYSRGLNSYIDNPHEMIGA